MPERLSARRADQLPADFFLVMMIAGINLMIGIGLIILFA
jgi:hypothetical protein